MSMEDRDPSPPVPSPATPRRHTQLSIPILDTPDVQRYQPIIELVDSDTEMPVAATQLDPESSSEMESEDITERYSADMWTSWINVYSDVATSVLAEPSTDLDSPRSRALKCAVQSQVFAFSLHKSPAHRRTGRHVASASQRRRPFRLQTKYGRCHMCMCPMRPTLIWRGPAEGLVMIRCKTFKRCLTGRNLSDSKILALPRKLVAKVNFLRSSPRFQTRFPYLKFFFLWRRMLTPDPTMSAHAQKIGSSGLYVGFTGPVFIPRHMQNIETWARTFFGLHSIFIDMSWYVYDQYLNRYIYSSMLFAEIFRICVYKRHTIRIEYTTSMNIFLHSETFFSYVNTYVQCYCIYKSVSNNHSTDTSLLTSSSNGRCRDRTAKKFVIQVHA